MNDFFKTFLPITVGWAFLVFSCKPSSNPQNSDSPAQESFREVPQEKVEALNRKLDSASVSRPEDIADIYKAALSAEGGRYSRHVSVWESGSEMLEITLEETGLPDDAVEGVKTLFDVRRRQSRYVVERIREAYRCYRGHQTWSAAPCP